ncbi:IS3 family transposase [Nesterenkonia alkaliphila]|uniref:IS3 family transposase n=1 Tax=Nesterenkonia alkaliphila TaxID=1463631 RepID=A0A7K1UL19_9MICC|nr:IS3 family transposase [Nesterenkonia alkaliphila]
MRVNSDAGSQDTSLAFTEALEEAGITGSIGSVGDNAAAETFFATLKNEMYHQQVLTTRSRSRFAVAEYIEVFYNRCRRHSSLGYRAPATAWAEHQQPAAADLPEAA